ncbi:hypothetical protein [Streptomyces nitrosporeus]|uniref:hypothetical protein n=1 Tax=Streptomyces nitrosporeus TaxID=28894 RepID=UPI0039A232CF
MYENRAREGRGPFEDELGAAMKRTGEGFSSAGLPLVDGGIARGRRRAVLRRGAVVTGSVAALAVIGLGGSYVTGGIGGSQGAGAAVGAPPAAKEAPAGQRPGSGNYSANQMIKLLEGLLPEGEFSGQEGRGTKETGELKDLHAPYASVVYDDGRGKAAVSVGLSRQYPGRQPDGDFLCPDKNLTAYEACSGTTLEDGSRLLLFKGWEYPDRREETRLWYADLLTPAGHRITVTEWNAPAEKGSPVSRPAPPLSLDQLEGLVRAAEWRPVIESLPEPAKPPLEQPDPEQLSGEEILRRLTGRFPERLTVKASGYQEAEYAFAVVDDGEGGSFVQINVQPDMSGVEGDLFGPDAKVLADGTKVTTREGPGEKGGAGVNMREVDTIRPDGFRVVVSAYNAAAQHEAASREFPALTLAELEEIATSTVWRS